MRGFSQLYTALDQTTSTNAKVRAMADYFASAPAAEAAWAVYFLSGRRLKRLVSHTALRSWLAAASDLPTWLVEETYANVGDLAETVALLLGENGAAPVGAAPVGAALVPDDGLRAWVEGRLLPLRGLEAAAQQTAVTGWWRELDYDGCYVVTKLLTGALRVGVSQTLVARALADVADLPRATILHRMMGDWEPTASYFKSLLAAEDGAAALSRPYPFFLAAPLGGEPQVSVLGAPDDWQMEWKWDGIRGQLIWRHGQCFLWSRGEELVTHQFPELERAALTLAHDCVLDGEILAWRADRVLPFDQLQRRIGRKRVGAGLLAEVPVVFMAYDLLESNGEDLRASPLAERRGALESLLGTGSDSLILSPILEPETWQAAAEAREEARTRQVEGLMLKRRASAYGVGRRRGDWWKWKVDPYTVDAVMIYAQAGRGRRSNLHTDYTFAVWDNDTLVPIAKAYSGLSNEEIRTLDKWIRQHTVERFGPVRSVVPEQVFELAFEGISPSGRHKSGVAVRFPRIARWRQDLGAGDADSLASVRQLMDSER